MVSVGTDIGKERSEEEVLRLGKNSVTNREGTRLRQREWLGGVGTQDVWGSNEKRNGYTTYLSDGHSSQALYICFGG